MGRGSFLVLVMSATGCTSADPAASSPNAAPASEATPSQGSSASVAGPHDDPASCVDLLPEQAEAYGRIDAALGKLGTCTTGLTERGHVQLSFMPRGGRTSVHVMGSSIHDCQVVACLTRGLEDLQLSFKPPASVSYGRFVALEPHAPPRSESPSDSNELLDGRDCIDPKVTTTAQPDARAPQQPGRLPPDQIYGIVRSHYGLFRRCYEHGLARDPSLTGRVGVRFVIDREGKVSGAHISDNTLPDCAVASCVRDAFQTLVFPKPEGGVVTVVYPVVLQPG